MKDYAIIYNPTSAAGKSKEDFDFAIKCLDKSGLSYDIFKSEHKEHAIELAFQKAKDGYSVIGCGGDGTCNEVFHGVITSKSGALCGFIPMGTGNDIPGAIGIVPDIKRACEVISENKTGKSDIGFAVTDAGVERYFIGIGSQGFDALVTKRTNERKKYFKGTKNYYAQVLRTVFTWKNQEIIVKMDNDKYEGLSNLVAVGNGPSYGGWMYMCPKARVNDGLFHISIVNMGKIKLLIDFNKLYSASLFPHEQIDEFVSKKVRIEMKNPEETPYIAQVDGEILGDIPITYEAIKDGFEFIKPEVDEVAEVFKGKYGRYFYE
ncbi:MAG: YegS/Rv2252/BmrU family lipid kinase [archaeon]|nr:YegS/Rv2252/BmrU family lipid kinase [archaeon]